MLPSCSPSPAVRMEIPALQRFEPGQLLRSLQQCPRVKRDHGCGAATRADGKSHAVAATGFRSSAVSAAARTLPYIGTHIPTLFLSVSSRFWISPKGAASLTVKSRSDAWSWQTAETRHPRPSIKSRKGPTSSCGSAASDFGPHGEVPLIARYGPPRVSRGWNSVPGHRVPLDQWRAVCAAYRAAPIADPAQELQVHTDRAVRRVRLQPIAGDLELARAPSPNESVQGGSVQRRHLPLAPECLGPGRQAVLVLLCKRRALVRHHFTLEAGEQVGHGEPAFPVSLIGGEQRRRELASLLFALFSVCVAETPQRQLSWSWSHHRRYSRLEPDRSHTVTLHPHAPKARAWPSSAHDALLLDMMTSRGARVGLRGKSDAHATLSDCSGRHSMTATSGCPSAARSSMMPTVIGARRQAVGRDTDDPDTVAHRH
jgi:hypothetical protein